MAELTLEKLLTAMKRRQPLPPEIRQDIIEGASKVGSFLWEGSGPGIATGMAKMRMENPDLSLSDVFPAVVGAGVLRGGGKFRPRVVQGGFSSLDDAKKFALTAEKQRVREQTLSEIFKARRAKEADTPVKSSRLIDDLRVSMRQKLEDPNISPRDKQITEGILRDMESGKIPTKMSRSTKPSTLRRPTRRELSELPKEEQDRILKAFDEGRIEEVKVQGPRLREAMSDRLLQAEEFASPFARGQITAKELKKGLKELGFSIDLRQSGSPIQMFDIATGKAFDLSF